MSNTLELIGNTPLYHIEGTNIYVKLEKYNAGGSIKDRAVLKMLQEAMRKGIVNKDSVLIEATSGNTGIALALLGAIYHIPVVIIMPESMSLERRMLIQAYGAKLVLTPKEYGMQGSIDEMEKLCSENPNYISLKQFDNPDNALAHYETTGKEIIEQCKDIDFFVCSVGTGGTFTGISRRLKEYNENIRCIVVEPQKSPVLSGGKPGLHGIQGIGANFVPSIFDKDLADDILLVSDEDAFEMCVRFGKQTGILVGISSGANLAGAYRLAKYYPDKKIVTIAPDGGEKYLSVLNFDTE